MDRKTHQQQIMKRVSVIIPAYNDAQNLKQTLLELYNIREREYANIEIIVSVRPSEDNTENIARRLADVVVEGGMPSMGRNAGIAVATGEVFIFLDADTRPGRGTIAAIVNACDANTIGSCTSHTPTRQFMPRLTAMLINLARWSHVIRGVSTLIFCHRNVVVRNGIHYNEHIALGEHHDFIHRARKAGFCWKYVRTTPGYTLSVNRYEAWGYITSLVFWLHWGIKQFLQQDVAALEQLYWSKTYTPLQRSREEWKRIGNAVASAVGMLVGMIVIFSGYIGPQQVLLLIFSEELKEDPSAPLIHALLKLLLRFSPEDVVNIGLIIAVCSVYVLLVNSKYLARARTSLHKGHERF